MSEFSNIWPEFGKRRKPFYTPASKQTHERERERERERESRILTAPKPAQGHLRTKKLFETMLPKPTIGQKPLCVCVCVCVCERERAREREREGAAQENDRFIKLLPKFKVNILVPANRI